MDRPRIQRSFGPHGNGSGDFSTRSRMGKGNIPPPVNHMGRPRGSHNKITTQLKQAILLAAEWAGEDLNGKNGLVGYCYRLAVLEPKTFGALLGRVLPLEVSAKVDIAELREPYETIEQAEAAMYELGLQPTRIYDMLIESDVTNVPVDGREAKST
jgi:hypothetical protein